jgi:hypothetical protein
MTIAFSVKQLRRLSENVSLNDLYAEPWRRWNRYTMSSNPHLTLQVLEDDCNGHFPSMEGEWDNYSLSSHSGIGCVAFSRFRKDRPPFDFGWEREYQNARTLAELKEILAIRQQRNQDGNVDLPKPDYWSLSWKLPFDDLLTAMKEGFDINPQLFSLRPDLTLGIINTHFRDMDLNWANITLTHLKRYQDALILQIMKTTDFVLAHSDPSEQSQAPDWRHTTKEAIERRNRFREWTERGIAFTRHTPTELSCIRSSLKSILSTYKRIYRWRLSDLMSRQEISVATILDCYRNNLTWGLLNYRVLSTRATIDDYLSWPHRNWNLTSILRRSRVKDLLRNRDKKRWTRTHLVSVIDITLRDFKYFPGLAPPPLCGCQWTSEYTDLAVVAE